MPAYIDLTGQIFGRLTVLARDLFKEGTFFSCLCQCGRIISTSSPNLKRGITKSCGCLSREILLARNIGNVSSRKYLDPSIRSAECIWEQNYSDCPFDIFLKLSQLDCNYCGLPASQSNCFNCYISKNDINNGKVSLEWGQKASFRYNGLDRIISANKEDGYGHAEGNLNSCCWICNRAKRERSVDQFMNHVNNLITQKHKSISVEHHKLQSLNISLNKIQDPKMYAYKSSAKVVYREEYSDGELSFEQFYQLSQMECYYCGALPSNKSNIHTKTDNSSKYARQTGLFIYNGLDRLNSSLPHNYHDNLTTCCRWCNYAKQKLSLNDFFIWINRLEQHQKKDKNE
jgi:hypothetical protein